MSYDFSYQAESGIAAFMAVYLIICLLSVGFGIASYVLSSLGTYTIAKRRELKNPWMAWVPMLNLWILGSISDQYRYVTQGKHTNKRKWLIGLGIAYIAVFFVSYIGMIVSVVMEELSYGRVDEESLIVSVLLGFLGMIVAMGLGIAMSVVRYIAMYDLYKSCKPDNAVMFLVLGIFLSVTEPFFIFACRNQDGGMPPRRPRPAAYIPEQYGYQPQQSPYQPQQSPYQPQQSPYQPQQSPYQPQQSPYQPQAVNYSPLEEPSFKYDTTAEQPAAAPQQWTPCEPEATPPEEPLNDQ